MTLPFTADTLTEALVGLIRTELLPRGLLRAAARVLRRRGDRRAAPQPHAGSVDRRDALRPLPRERGRHPRHDLVLAPRGRQHDPGPRQDHRLLRQLGLRQDRRAAGRLRRGDRPERGRPRLRGLGRELLPRQERRRGHAARSTDNILEGITRRTVLELLRETLGITVVERSIDRTELYLADEAFFCGTGVQIAAITRVDHRPIGTGTHGPRRLRPARPLLRRRPRQACPTTATGATPSTRTRPPPLSPKADASRPAI